MTFSFRGHGRSGGRSTVGDREVLDVAAAVAWARELGHDRVATVGFSMGGSVVLRHAALHGPGREGGAQARTDAVASVSAPARWYYRGTAPMRRVHWLITRPAGRLVGRYGFRTRIHDRDWDPVPLSPVEAVPLIVPAVPLLVVHGDRDPYFPLDHSAGARRGGGRRRRAVAGAGDGARRERRGRRPAGPDRPLAGGGSAGRVAHDGTLTKGAPMAAGTIRYWAAAKAAAGIAEEPYAAQTLAEALDAARRRHPGELERVLKRCSFLVDGDPVGTRAHETVRLAEGGTVEVLPPFAGG